MRILTSSEMKQVDRLTSERYQVPSLTLMENAGSGIASFAASLCEALSSARILIVCGKGNNGGDGLVAARHLLNRGALPQVVLLATYNQVHGDARANLDALIQAGLRPIPVTTPLEWDEFAAAVPPPRLIIDAIVGTGLSKPLDGYLAHIVEDLGKRFANSVFIAVDLPSGLNSDTNEVMGPVLRATTTLTMTAPKVCLAFPPSAEFAGEVRTIPIGSPDELIEEITKQDLYWLTEEDFRFIARPRALNSNKGAYGHCLIIAGSLGKTGAAVLAGKSALRSGAGLVTIATASGSQPVVAQALPELMTIPLAETQTGSIDLSAFDYGAMDNATQEKTVVALGPGLSQQPDTQEFARRTVVRYRMPMVVDADGLNAFADHNDLLDGHGRVLVLTPHPGEFGRLIRTTARIVQSDRKNFAREFAVRHQVILVLKGFRTLIACPDGKIFVCPKGNPGMAKGGSGDVLTGMVAGMLAQYPTIDPARTVSAAVFMHAWAGDCAREKFGEMAMLAGDIIECIPEALSSLTQSLLQPQNQTM